MVIICWLKHTLLITLTVVISLYPSHYLCAQGSPVDPNTLSFLFAIGAQIAKGGDYRAVPVEDDIVLNSGDRIKFFLKTTSAGYFYLFHLDPNGNLSILFPLDLREAHIPSGQQFYIPKEPLWFELNATPGVERFFFLASNSRLRRLEDFSTRHADLKDGCEVQSSTWAILDEISYLNKEHRSLAGSAERPVRMAGRIREQPKKDSVALPDITPFAKEIVVQGFYSKTITIEHR
jgi:hypothetical protein